jgi:hypothetical protein
VKDESLTGDSATRSATYATGGTDRQFRESRTPTPEGSILAVSFHIGGLARVDRKDTTGHLGNPPSAGGQEYAHDDWSSRARDAATVGAKRGDTLARVRHP